MSPAYLSKLFLISDLNPTENLWVYLKKSAQEKTQDSARSGEVLVENPIFCVLKSNATHYKRRLRAAQLAKGGCTKY